LPVWPVCHVTRSMPAAEPNRRHRQMVSVSFA
jgi:hypothetical protein